MRESDYLFNGEVGQYLGVIHISAFIGLYFLSQVKYLTVIYYFFIFLFSSFAVNVGYHRLYSHKSYKSSLLLDLFYMFFGTASTQISAIWWARHHRTHHRNEEQEGDPYNIKKGFFHAHIGWLIKGNSKKEKEEIMKTDVSDLEKNIILKFQQDNIGILWFIVNFGISIVPLLWGETISNSIVSNLIRIIFNLHSTFSINSFAHSRNLFGTSTLYNPNLNTVDSLLVSILTMGDGSHNYHHNFPKDYRSSDKFDFSPSTWFLYKMKYLGLTKNHYVKGDKDIPYDERFNLDYYQIEK